jgi:hypothetical protein
MIETILKWWNGLLHVLTTLPPSFAALLVGWSFSIGLTQSVKFLMPSSIDEDIRELTTRLLAGFSAAMAAGVYYAAADGSRPEDLILVMLFTGVWSPLAFALLQGALRRSPRTAWIADVLSGDVRGVIAAKLRGDPGDVP